ncbi:MAG: alpha/beta hydrolase [Paracoccaceae bacterium]|nr:MAG: alpha/beta hydrolase [Paracoccaceae bacterium]
MTESDYQTLIDAPTWAFIHATAAHYPDDTAFQGVAEQRRVYDAMCAAFRRPRPEGVAVTDADLGGVPARHYRSGPALVRVIYLHGGGFVVGGLDSHDDVCAEICAATGLPVSSIDYRLAPEHLHPAAYDDALAATRAALAAGPTILCGDSAGGNLAAAVVHALRGAPGLIGQVLIYPGLGGDTGRGSHIRHAHAPMLTRDDVLAYARLRHGGPPPVGDPTASPLQDNDFSRLPPSLVVTAECDPLSDDGQDYVRAIRAAGGQAVWIEEPGLVHGYLRARHSVPRAGASFARICAALLALAEGRGVDHADPDV